MAIENDGFSSFRKTPTVELIMPAPIRATSGSVLMLASPGFVKTSPPCPWSCGIPVGRIGFERKCGARREYEVGTPPRFIADQLPAMSRTRVVLRQQDVTGTYGEALTTACLEFQRTAERDDKARHRSLVPLIGSTGFGLLEGQTDAAEHVALKVASLAPGKIDCSFLIPRVAIFAGPQSHTSDHDVFFQSGAARQ